MSDYAAGHAKPRYLPRLTIDSLTYHDRRFSLSSMTSSTRASVASSLGSSTSSVDSFFVYCVYDFEAADADQLSFRSTEILEVVKVEDSGWWAAIRDGEYKAGWIPSAFVEPISDEEAHSQLGHLTANREAQSLPEAKEDDSDQSYESMFAQAQRYVYSPPGEQFSPDFGLYSSKPLPPTPHDLDTPKNVVSPLSAPFSPTQTRDPQSPSQEIILSPAKTRRAVPPSPSTPVPQPPPKSAPLASVEGAKTNMKRSVSCPYPNVTTTVYASSGDPNTSPSRTFRRRPMLIEDSLSLKRLSVLLEAHDMEEAEQYLYSPDMTETTSFPSRAIASGSRSSSEKVRQILGDEQAHALHAAHIAEANSPWYLRPMYGEDEIHVEYNGWIAGGTLPAIVERLTLDPINALLDFKLRRTFLTTFRTFSTADNIYDLLLEQYSLKVPEGLSLAEVDEWRTKRLLPTQRRVLLIFKTWLVDHAMIEDDPPIAAKLQTFLTSIVAPSENAPLAHEVMHTLERLTFAVPATPEPSSKPHKRKKTKDSKNELWRLDPNVLAEHLCMYEHKFYAQVRPQECLDWVKSGERAGNLFTFCALHDKLASWVKQSVLWTDNLGRRADTVDFWIKVAEKCKTMHNYSSASAIVTALSSRVISKLYLTWAHVGDARRASHLGPLTKLNDPSGGFAAFRQAQQAIENDGTPCVPFVGMYLTDIVHVNDKYKDKDIFIPCKNQDTNERPVQEMPRSERYYSFVKRRKWSEVLDEMLAFQRTSYPFVQDPAITQLLETSLLIGGEKDQAVFWEKSEQVLKAEVESADIRKGLKDAGF